MFEYAHIGYYVKQVFLPYVNNIKLLITDIHNRISYSSPVGSIVTWSIPGEPIGVSKGYLLECNGQSFDPEKYPNLYKALGIDRVPNYRGQFLRCERDGYIAGDKVPHSFMSHNHTQPTHNHNWSGKLVNTTISGTAKGQKYFDMKMGVGYASSIVHGTAEFKAHCYRVMPSLQSVSKNYFIMSPPPGNRRILTTDSAGDPAHYHTTSISDSTHAIVDGGYDYADPSSVSGSVNNGTVDGTVAHNSAGTISMEGGAETAPDHTYVKYFIRAR